MKTCNKCNTNKSFTEFCRRSDSPDGYDYRCRKCEAIRRADYHEKHKQQDLDRGRVYAAERRRKEPRVLNGILRKWREKNPLKSRSNTAERRVRFPEMTLAHQAAFSLVVKGKDAHHWSYQPEHWMDVIHLSKTEHRRLHRLMYYDQSEKKFRLKADHSLLISKNHHLDLLKQFVHIELVTP